MRVPWIDAALPALGLVVALACMAHAHPRHFQETGRPCSSCHADPAGGPALTSAGREYKQYRMLTDMHALSMPIAVEPPGQPQLPIESISPDPDARSVYMEPESGGGRAGLLAMGFGLTSFCILAFRRSR